MATVSQEIREILKLKDQAEGSRTNAQSVSAEAHEKIEQLRERIRQGETTGDKIKDFIIARYGFLDDGIEATYRALEARLCQHVGEFILMIVKQEIFFGCTGFGQKPRDRDFLLTEHFYLGVLKDGALVLNIAGGKCEIPTGNYAECLNLLSEKSELVEENLNSRWGYDFGIDLDRPIKRRNPMARLQKKPDLKLELKVGDEEVRAWFEQRNGPHLVIFQKSAQLLGRPIAEFLQLSAELQRRREAIAKRLIGLVKERDQLKKKIAQIFDAINWGAFSDDGVSVTVCENEDDARVISMGPRQKLNNVESQIRHQLNAALALGMADVQLLSIRQLCQEYEIKTS